MAIANYLHLASVEPPADELAAQVSAAARGDPRAFEQLYRRHVGQIYGLCLRMSGNAALAEDCTQECFIAAWRALSAFEGRSRFATWLHRIAVNCVLAKRTRGRDPAISLELVRDEVQILAGERDAAPPIDVERAIRTLPEGARHVLVLVGLYGFTHEEAAHTLGIAVGTCKAQLHRARGLLSERLGLAEANA